MAVWKNVLPYAVTTGLGTAYAAPSSGTALLLGYDVSNYADAGTAGTVFVHFVPSGSAVGTLYLHSGGQGALVHPGPPATWRGPRPLAPGERVVIAGTGGRMNFWPLVQE